MHYSIKKLARDEMHSNSVLVNELGLEQVEHEQK